MTAASKITFIEITFIRMGYAAASQKHIYRNGYARRISRTHLQEWLCLPSPKNTFTGIVMLATSQKPFIGMFSLLHPKKTFTGMVKRASSQKHIYRSGLFPPCPKNTFTGMGNACRIPKTHLQEWVMLAASQKHIYMNVYACCVPKSHLQEWLCSQRPKTHF